MELLENNGGQQPPEGRGPFHDLAIEEALRANRVASENSNRANRLMNSAWKIAALAILAVVVLAVIAWAANAYGETRLLGLVAFIVVVIATVTAAIFPQGNVLSAILGAFGALLGRPLPAGETIGERLLRGGSDGFKAYWTAVLFALYGLSAIFAPLAMVDYTTGPSGYWFHFAAGIVGAMIAARFAAKSRALEFAFVAVLFAALLYTGTVTARGKDFEWNLPAFGTVIERAVDSTGSDETAEESGPVVQANGLIHAAGKEVVEVREGMCTLWYQSGTKSTELDVQTKEGAEFVRWTPDVTDIHSFRPVEGVDYEWRKKGECSN